MEAREIPAAVRSLLAQLELLSHGSTQAWNSAGGGHGASTAVLPFGELYPEHERYRHRYQDATTDAERDDVVKDIRKALKEARGHVDRSHVTGETRQEEDARIVSKGRGFTADEVARAFNCTASRVRSVRIAASCDAKYGNPLTDDVEASGVDPMTEALRLKGKGMTQRQIAFAIGQPKSTVGRWLKDAA